MTWFFGSTNQILGTVIDDFESGLVDDRLLGSLAEAEDVAQETYTRWYARQQHATKLRS